MLHSQGKATENGKIETVNVILDKLINLNVFYKSRK